MSNSLFHLVRNAVLGASAILLLAQAPAAAADDVLSVYLGAHTPPLMNALNLIAAGAGFYKDDHLDVTTIRVASANAAGAMCARGQADICPGDIEAGISGYPHGDFLRMFLTRASKFGYVVAVLDSSPIKTLAEVKGNIIGVHNTVSSDVSNVGGALASLGLKPGDYSLVPIGMEDAAINQLTSGKVQVVALPFYELIPYMVGGLKLRIFHNPTLENAANAGYLASPDTLKNKHDQIARFSRAIVKAALLIRTQPEFAARALLKANGDPFTEADVKRKMAEFAVWQDFLPAADPSSHRIGTPSMTGMATYLKILKDAGILKYDVPVSAVVTDEFSAAANDFDHKTVETMTK